MRVAVVLAVAAILALLCATETQAANLVMNGGFETETPAGCQTASNGLCNLPPAGWIANSGIVVDAIFPNTGTYDAALGNTAVGGPGTLSQALVTTPGQTYTISFSVIDESGSAADSITVTFGGLTATIAGNRVPSYTAESFSTRVGDITAPSTSLVFSARNGLSDFNLDDVSVSVIPTAIPEPKSAILLGTALASWLCGAIFLHQCSHKRR